jgi:hypothetical protein
MTWQGCLATHGIWIRAQRGETPVIGYWQLESWGGEASSEALAAACAGAICQPKARGASLTRRVVPFTEGHAPQHVLPEPAAAKRPRLDR